MPNGQKSHSTSYLVGVALGALVSVLVVIAVAIGAV